MCHGASAWCFRLALALALLLSAGSLHAAELRVVTFNIAMGRALNLLPGTSVAGAFSELSKLKGADVIALQEVCLNQPEQLQLFLDVMQNSAERVFHYSDYAETKRGKACEKGQATLSRYPIQAAGTIQLPRVGAERSAIWIDVMLEGGRVARVYNLHLSNRAGRRLAPIDGRLLQVARVLDHAASLRRLNPEAPMLLMGDFNSLSSLVDPWRNEVALQRVSRHFSPSIKHFSPTMVLPYQVDWIFYRGLRLQQSQAVRIFHSDHFPVMADFRMPG